MHHVLLIDGQTHFVWLYYFMYNFKQSLNFLSFININLYFVSYSSLKTSSQFWLLGWTLILTCMSFWLHKTPFSSALFVLQSLSKLTQQQVGYRSLITSLNICLASFLIISLSGDHCIGCLLIHIYNLLGLFVPVILPWYYRDMMSRSKQTCLMLWVKSRVTFLWDNLKVYMVSLKECLDLKLRLPKGMVLEVELMYMINIYFIIQYVVYYWCLEFYIIKKIWNCFNCLQSYFPFLLFFSLGLGAWLFCCSCSSCLLTSNWCSFEYACNSQGAKHGEATLKLVNSSEGLYMIYFQSTLSALQSFSIAVAIIHAQTPELYPKL